MSPAHTPGPWVVTEDMGSNIIRGTEEERAVEGLAGITYKWRDYVASTWGGPHEANARLIAAAPEMLQALLVADRTFAENGLLACHAARQEIRAAIAEATGEQQ